jgi:serine protease AprX
MPQGSGDRTSEPWRDVLVTDATPAPRFTYKENDENEVRTGAPVDDAPPNVGAHVADAATGIDLTGEQDIMGQPWKPAIWTATSAAGSSCNGGTWNASPWSGSGWTGTSWAARTWSGRTWSARTWSGSTWTARTWSGGYWSSKAWS